MQGLLGDRFLKKFSGILKYRRKKPTSKTEENNTERDEGKVSETFSEEEGEACAKVESQIIEETNHTDKTNQK